MFGEDVGFSTVNNRDASEEYNAAVDLVVKKILDVSFYQLLTVVGFIRSCLLTDQQKGHRVKEIG